MMKTACTNIMHSIYLDADGKVRHFNAMKTRCGFAQFLSLDVLKDPRNGYLMDDSCIFGAEVFVIKYSGKGESLSMIKDPVDGTFTWTIENFSALNQEVLDSEIFTVKELKWHVLMHFLHFSSFLIAVKWINVQM